MNFRLLLIGDGPLRRDLEQAVRRHEIDAEFTGFLALDDVRVWLNRASVVAVPSVTAADGDSEGLPTIVLEAQAMSTPIVATRHSGIPEGVLEAETAELVEERDVDALAAALGSFLSSPDKQRAFGSAGRRFVSEHFDLNDQVRGLEALYGELRKQYPARARARR